jgi:cation:H+ antiporter
MAVALVLGAAPPPLMLAIVLLLLLPYALLLALRRGTIHKLPRKLPLPDSWIAFAAAAASEEQEEEREIEQAAGNPEDNAPPKPSHASMAKLLAFLFGALGVIILGSVGLVKSTAALTAGWLPHSLLGTLVLAMLTGIPNLYTATRLAQRHRGSAVVTEALNSNNLNVLVGLAIPSLVFGSLRAHTAGGYLDTGWLLLMTVATIAMVTLGRGLKRKAGLAIIAAYLAFVGVRIYLSI